MEKQPLTYDFSAVIMPALAFNGIGIIQWEGGNSLIINELNQKPSDFTENLLKEYSGGTEAINAFNDINALGAAAFVFSCNFKPNNKQLLTNLSKNEKNDKVESHGAFSDDVGGHARADISVRPE